MSPHLTFLLALAGLAHPQGEPPAPPPEALRSAAGGPWELVNQIHIIVNEDVLTLRQLEVRVQRMLEVQPVSSPAEMSALRGEVATRAVQDLLMIQRGRDLGFDPAFVKHTVSSYMREQAESAGGVSELAERLSLRGETAAARKETITDELYAASYERAITGQAPGPGGRPTQDRYVRPGLLALGYDQLRHEPAGVRAVGGRAEHYVLQQLVLATAPFDDPQQAREYVEDLRRQALEGEDFDTLVETYSLVSEERGLTRPLTLAELWRVEPAVARFCQEGAVGDLSEVLPILEGEKPVYFRVLRIHEHQPLDLPPFRSASVQDRLRQVVLRNRDLMLREESVRELFQASYIWTPERIRPPSGGGPEEPGSDPEGDDDGESPDGAGSSDGSEAPAQGDAPDGAGSSGPGSDR